MLVTNFPKDIEVTKQYIKDLCLSKDKTAVINHIHLENAMRGES